MPTSAASPASIHSELFAVLHQAATSLPAALASPVAAARALTTLLAESGFAALVYLSSNTGGLSLAAAQQPSPPSTNHHPHVSPPGVLPAWNQGAQRAGPYSAALISDPDRYSPALWQWVHAWEPQAALALAPVCVRERQLGLLLVAGTGLSSQDLPLLEILASQFGANLASSQATAGHLLENHFQRLFETALDGLLLIDPASQQVLFANPRFTELSQYALDELTGLAAPALFPREYRDLVEVILSTVHQYGRSQVELPLLKKNGEQVVVHMGAALFEASGHPLVQVFFHDQSESEKVKQALRESETKFRAVAETTTSAIFIFRHNAFHYVNPALALASGYSSEELLSMRVFELVHPQFRPLVKDRIRRIAQGDTDASRFEVKMCCKNGETRWLDLNVREIMYEGSLAGIGTAFDVTERKQTEQALIESEEKLRSLVQKSTDGVVMIDEQGRIIEWNPGQEQITGIPRAAAVGRFIWDVQHSLTAQEKNTPEAVAATKVSIQEFLETGSAPWINQPREQEVYPVDGSERRFVQVVTFPVPTQIGFMAGSISRDVTRNKMLEAELRRRAEEAEMLHQATAALTTTLELDEVLSSVLERLEQVLPFDSSAVFLLEGSHLVGKAARGLPLPDQFINHRFPSHDPLFRNIQTTGKTMIIADAQTDPRFSRWVETGYVRGWMGVPFIAKDEVIGYLTCDSRQAGTYGPRQATLAEAFANQAAMAIENARLYQAERTARAQAEILREVGALLTTQLGLQEVLERILDLLGRAVPYDSASVHLLVEGEQRLYLAAGHGLPDLEVARRTVYNLSETILQTKWSRHEVIIIPDTLNSPRWVQDSEMGYIRSWAGAPLLVKGRFIGSLNVDSVTVDAYDALTGEIVMAFANQAAVAIENARLFDAERTARERAEALREAAQAISSTLSLEGVLKAVLEQLARVLNFDTGNVMLVEGETVHIKAWRGYESFGDPSLIDSIRFPIADNEIIHNLFRNPQHPLVIQDTEEHPAWVHTMLSSHVRSWLGIPLCPRDKVIGLVGLDRVAAGGFTDEEVDLAQSFALHAAAAIENARLYEAVGKRAAELETLRQASLSVTSSLDLPQVLDAILASTLTLVPEASNSHIFLYSPEGEGQLTFGAAMWQDGRRGGPWAEPRQHGMTYKVAREGVPYIIPDMTLHPLYRDDPRCQGAITGLPLKIGQRVVGVMNTAYNQPRALSEDELHLLRLLGDQAALAIENARLFEQAAIERRHLGLLYDVGREVSTSLDPDQILERAITLTCQALHGLLGQAFLYVADENRLSLRALYGSPKVSLEETDRRLNLKPGSGLAGWVMEHKQATCVADLNHDPRWIKIPGIDEDINTVISAPILSGDHVLGVLNVLHRESGAFTEAHLALLQGICQELSLALSNAERYQQVERRLAEMTLIQSLTETFTQRLEPQILYEEVVNQLAQRLGYTQVEVFEREDDQILLRAYTGPEPRIKRLNIKFGIMGRVVREGRAALVPDVTADDDFIPGADNVVAELAVPIFRRSQVVGVINVHAERAAQLDHQDRELLEVLAGQISIAMENASLYERVRSHADELELIVARRTAELSELYELSQGISYQLSYDELLRLLLHHLRQAVRCDAAVGCLMPETCSDVWVDTERLIMPSVVEGLRDERVEPFLRKNIFPTCGSDGKLQLMILNQMGIDDRAQPIQNAGSVLLVPIQVEQAVVGFLMAVYESEQAFSAEHERLLTMFANQASAAVQRVSAILAAQQQHLENLVEHLPVGILLFNSDFELLVANPLGSDILSIMNGGFPVERLERLGPCSLETLLDRAYDPLPVEITLDGPPRSSFAAQIRRIGSENQQWILTIRDITQERENQERIQSQERLATVGQLAAGIAHDFNNIMAAILVYADLLRHDPALEASSREKLGIIQQQVQRATSLIRQILDFSRRSVIEQSALDLLPFIKELDKMLGRVLPENIRLELLYQPGAYWVHADPTRLQQVFMNLALNARDAMPQGGLLRFELNRLLLNESQAHTWFELPPGSWLEVVVSDTGLGIAHQVLPHIFDPFFTTKPVGQGTGLGLAQVYGIVKQHGGYIDVKSEPGAGAVFHIYLPELAQVEPVQEAPSPAAAFTGGGEWVLLVEDNDITREALQALLEALNYQVIPAADGVEALESFDHSRQNIILVISDLVMPRLGGIALQQALKERGSTSKLLIITGHPMEEDSQALLETGTVRWLQKPFSVAEFTEAVQALLERA